MKRLFFILLAAMLLCGCSQEPELTIPTEVPEVQTTAPAGDGLIRNPQEETEAPEKAPVYGGQAGYSILENDHSIRNDSGEILVTIRYDQVILDTSEPRWEAINNAIREDYQAFLRNTEDLRDTSTEDWEAQLESMGAVYGNLLCIRTPEVTHNNGVFSIRIQQEWFMGGVYNCDSYGLNFDLATGNELLLPQLSEQSEEEFEAQLKQIVCDALTPDRDALLEDPAKILKKYTLSDFSWCIEDGELVLLFPTYTFGPGAMGSTAVKTGLYI